MIFKTENKMTLGVFKKQNIHKTAGIHTNEPVSRDLGFVCSSKSYIQIIVRRKDDKKLSIIYTGDMHI